MQLRVPSFSGTSSAAGAASGSTPPHLRGLRRAQEASTSLADFIANSPDRSAPLHLQPLLDLFERIAAGEQVRAIVSTPPQHGKSETVLHGLVWLMLRNPARRHAYATYAQEFTRSQSVIAARAASLNGLPLTRATLDRWETPQGGAVAWTSRGGPLTGHPVDGLLLIDDLLKDRLEANSALIRSRAMDWLSSTAFTRRHPTASTVIVATRWHLADPSGQLAEKPGWEVIKLPAIRQDGTALWPEQRPLEWLEEQRSELLPADWSALYMCEPVADGSRVFKDATYYDHLPEGGYRIGHGFDAAYTAKTSADATVTISGRLVGEKIYVTNLLHDRLEPMHYIPLMRAAGVDRVTWYRSGTERGLEELLKREGIQVNALTATTDKLSRAIPAATAWNRGDILLPKSAPWAPQVESELSQFTGQGDKHDDIVDALAALHHALVGTPEYHFAIS